MGISVDVGVDTTITLRGRDFTISENDRQVDATYMLYLSLVDLNSASVNNCLDVAGIELKDSVGAQIWPWVP